MPRIGTLVSNKTPLGTPCGWRAGFRPSAAPDVTLGTFFSKKGQVVCLIDADRRPQFFAAKAIVTRAF